MVVMPVVVTRMIVMMEMVVLMVMAVMAVTMMMMMMVWLRRERYGPSTLIQSAKGGMGV